VEYVDCSSLAFPNDIPEVSGTTCHNLPSFHVTAALDGKQLKTFDL
jgi:hypothetical protein